MNLLRHDGRRIVQIAIQRFHTTKNLVELREVVYQSLIVDVVVFAR